MLERFGFQVKCALNRGKYHTLETLSLLTKSASSKSNDESNDTSDDSSEDKSDEETPTHLAPSDNTVFLISSLYQHLFTVCGEIDLPAVNEVLAQCPDEEDVLAVEDRDHYNLLHKAIIFDNIELAELLAGRVADVNTLRSCGPRCPHSQLGALHLASFLGRHRLVSWLLSLGADSRAQRRVYLSAPVDCPANRQVTALCSGRDEQMGRLLSTCGPRDAAFFAVIADCDKTMLLLLNGGQWDVVKDGNEQRINHKGAQGSQENQDTSGVEGKRINQQSSTIKDNELDIFVDDHSVDDAIITAMMDYVDARHGYLLHVSCRVGALRCLRWLLRFYPSELCVSASDGLPALLLALPHGPVPVRMLLHAGADVRDVQHFWEEGRNMLHLLYAALPFSVPCRDGLSDVTELCIAGGASVREERQAAGRTPLHDLMAAFNCVHGGNTHSDTLAADMDLLDCMRVLLSANAPVGVLDADGRTPLAVLTANQHYISRLRSETTVNCYGLDNTVAALATLLASMSTDQINDERPLLEFLVHIPLRNCTEDVYSGCSRVLDMLVEDRSLSDASLRRLLDRVTTERELNQRSIALVRTLLRRTCSPAALCVDYLQRIATQRDIVSALLPLFLQYIPPGEFSNASDGTLLMTFSQLELRDLIILLMNHGPYHHRTALRSAFLVTESPDLAQFIESRLGVRTLKSLCRYRVWCHLWKLSDPFATSQLLVLPVSLKTYLQSFAD